LAGQREAERTLSDEGQTGWTRWKRRFLAADSFIDDTLFRTGEALRDGWERFSLFMDRFHVSGVRRLAVEGLSEGATLGAAGLVLMLALAVPAFEETKDDDWLAQSELSVTFLDRFGNEIGRRGIRHNDTLPLSAYPDHLIKATMATEDRRFFDHFGIDIPGTLRALTTNVRAGGVVQGGSTLTQQLAKNLFLSNERTLERKIKEAFLAIWLEARLSKNEILKLYLDRAYLGGGTFGVDAAAHYYFNKSARDLSLAEAAMLAGLFKAPTRFAPHVNLPAARARASSVLDNLVEAGFMTEGQVFGARRNPATPIDRRDEQLADYFLDFAFEDIKAIAETLPRGKGDRVFVARTSLDTNLQRQAEQIVDNQIRQFGQEYGAREAAGVIMDLDGAVRALVGGRDYGRSQFNRATDALRQPGSSFKPFIYLTAFQNGYRANSVMSDAPICIGDWCPQNYSRSFSGPVTLNVALTRSINTIPVRLAEAMGRGKIIDTARRLGISTELKITRALPLGVAEVTLMEMTGAYAVLAAGGLGVRPHAVLEIKSVNGQSIWRFDHDRAKPVQVAAPQAVAELNNVLVSAVENGTGRRAILDGVRVAGKTGTTQGYRDAWFLGYTGNFVGGIWFGNDDYTPTKRMTGGSLPAMTWQQIMTFAHRGAEVRPIFGVQPAQPTDSTRVPVASTPGTDSSNPAVTLRVTGLTRRGTQSLARIEALMTEAMRNMDTATPGRVSQADAPPAPTAQLGAPPR
jgi:penicillin-binding protein 1A